MTGITVYRISDEKGAIRTYNNTGQNMGKQDRGRNRREFLGSPGEWHGKMATTSAKDRYAQEHDGQCLLAWHR
jgi:hypothetical protein